MGSGSACMERMGTSRSCPSGPARQVAGRHVVGQPDAVGGLVEGVGRPRQKTRLASLPKLSRASITLATGGKAVLGLLGGHMRAWTTTEGPRKLVERSAA